MCVVLYYQPSAPPDEDGRFLFQWNDNNCNSKNNFVCKYSEGESETFMRVSWEPVSCMSLNHPIGPIAGPRWFRFIFPGRVSGRRLSRTTTGFTVMRSLTSGADVLPRKPLLTYVDKLMYRGKNLLQAKTGPWPNLNSSDLRKYENERLCTCCRSSRVSAEDLGGNGSNRCSVIALIRKRVRLLSAPRLSF